MPCKNICLYNSTGVCFLLLLRLKLQVGGGVGGSCPSVLPPQSHAGFTGRRQAAFPRYQVDV